ncbi:hypothetical protein G6F24_015649 [Rhizopus arrhizus]|nr:hypothetical protein G6F24_015649 [Rhizopus arrhizus]
MGAPAVRGHRPAADRLCAVAGRAPSAAAGTGLGHRRHGAGPAAGRTGAASGPGTGRSRAAAAQLPAA